jgi:hypothetical protein
MSFIDNLKKGWNAFLGRDPTMSNSYLGSAYSYGSLKPDRWIWNPGSERTIVTAILQPYSNGYCADKDSACSA